MRVPLDDSAAHRREVAAVLADIAAHPWPDDIHAARALYDDMGPPIAPDISAEIVAVGPLRAQILTPPASDPDRVVLFLHGGGFVYGSLVSHGGMAGEVARASHCRCVQLEYRLAPEHPFPAAIDDACAACEWLIAQGFAPERTAIVGDSAGGGLVVSTLAALKAAGRPLPGAAVCISPWVDMEATGESYDTRQAMDPMIDRAVVALVSGLYLNGQDPHVPAASPIHADLHGMPPLLVQVGEREVLFSEAENLAIKAEAAGVEVIFEEWPDMVHVWHLYYPILSAGRDAIARIGAFIVRATAYHSQRLET